jgi:3-oxoacyl-[acyl-carrier-protein] synthase-3
MQYRHVYLESLGYTLPDEIVTSIEIERRLKPLYERLRLAEGRLELMTGIRERRFWPAGLRPSDQSIASAERAIAAAGIDRRHIGALVHGSVCRDELEPATAARVHHELDLSAECVIHDVSNACLGLMSGVLQVANMIELGQIRAGLVVGTENGRPLVEATIESLNRNTSLTRQDIKTAIASLTIGSGSCAILLCDPDLTQTGNRLAAGVARAETAHHRLCHGSDTDGGGMLMQTDSEQLMHAGVTAAHETFRSLMERAGWSPADFDKTIGHQVGGGHRKLLCEQLGINPANDFTTFEWLGNTGSVALPITLAVALEQGFIGADDTVGLLGIGSGIVSVMLAVEWQKTLVASPPHERQFAATPALATGSPGA